VLCVGTVYDAVIVPTPTPVERPNVIPLLLLNVIADKLLLVVLADTFNANDPVIVDAFNPNETLFEFEKVIADNALLVVPADTFIFVRDDATDAVKVPTPTPVLNPNETLFEFEKVIPDKALLVPPGADTFSAKDAVNVEPLNPNVILFEFDDIVLSLGFCPNAPIAFGLISPNGIRSFRQ